jgi:predicted nucleic acid-binding protein
VLDVNTLLALVVLEHEFHMRVAKWVKRLEASGVLELASCPITELGFVRVLGQARQYGLPVAQARDLLLKVKNSDGMRWPRWTAESRVRSSSPRAAIHKDNMKMCRFQFSGSKISTRAHHSF